MTEHNFKSSVNKEHWQCLKTDFMSLKDNENSKGDKRPSCGTPECTSNVSEILGPTLIHFTIIYITFNINMIGICTITV